MERLNAPKIVWQGAVAHLLGRAALVLLLVGPLALVAACDDEDERKTCASSGDPVQGIQGLVVSPNCNANISSAEVNLMHGDGTVLQATTGADGRFTFSFDELGNRTGFWRITVGKGPFTADSVDVRVADDGTSDFQVIPLDTGG